MIVVCRASGSVVMIVKIYRVRSQAVGWMRRSSMSTLQVAAG